MAKIVGLGDMTLGQLEEQVSKGGRFVYYEWCISVVVMSFKRGTDIHWIPPGQGSFGKGVPFTLLSLVVGWWGIPWGFIYTPMVLATNLGGGKNVTAAVMQNFRAHAYAQTQAQARQA